MNGKPVRPNGMNVTVNEDAQFALVSFEGIDMPPILLKSGDCRRIGGTIAGLEGKFND